MIPPGGRPSPLDSYAVTRDVEVSPESLLDLMLDLQIVPPGDWERAPPSARREVRDAPAAAVLVQRLLRHRLLTDFQAARVGEGRLRSLVVGNYRLLERVGSGGMGVVYRAEHRLMRRVVALKAFEPKSANDHRYLQRFFAEIEATAKLQHPNIVAAFDAGEVPGTEPGEPDLCYLVMEFIPGRDLERIVREDGPLPPARACEVAFQVASALGEAHRNGLVHRDVKPSNVRLTPAGQAKLLDFGLARQLESRQTEHGVAMGTVEYMAPEQARDARNVDIRADIYALGGTLYWCLTGRPPFPPTANILEAMYARQTQAAASLLDVEGVTLQLDALVRRMLAADPAARFGTPEEVLRALAPHLKRSSPTAAGPRREASLGGGGPDGPQRHRVLIVDDEPLIRRSCRIALEIEHLACEEAGDGRQALAAIRAQPFDCVLLDVDMPELGGKDVCLAVRADALYQHVKIIMMSGRSGADELAQFLASGADDYLTKPLGIVQLQARVKNALRLRDAQERSDLLSRRLLAVNAELEKAVGTRDADLVHARNALALALAKLVEQRDAETGAHVQRLQRFARTLGEAAMGAGPHGANIDGDFLDMLECSAPLHDVGKLALPDHILLKAGDLDPQELALMETHTTAGSEVLREVARSHPFAQAFLQTADEIARHHHERYDGAGYPDRLAGDAIPLAARIVAVCDGYDTLRSRRPYKPALSHSAAMHLMTRESSGQFDPALLAAFERCHERFAQIYAEMADSR